MRERGGGGRESERKGGTTEKSNFHLKYEHWPSFRKGNKIFSRLCSTCFSLSILKALTFPVVGSFFSLFSPHNHTRCFSLFLLSILLISHNSFPYSEFPEFLHLFLNSSVSLFRFFINSLGSSLFLSHNMCYILSFTRNISRFFSCRISSLNFFSSFKKIVLCVKKLRKYAIQ